MKDKLRFKFKFSRSNLIHSFICLQLAFKHINTYQLVFEGVVDNIPRFQQQTIMLINAAPLYFLYFRYLLNDACVLAQKPLVSGSALRFEGQVS